MKTFSILLIFALAGIATGCHELAGQLRGSGKRIVEKREMGDFKSLSTEGAFEIRIVCQKSPGLEIEGDDNILPAISTSISNGVLHVKSLRNYRSSEPITLRLTVNNLEALSVSGAGRVDIEGVNADQFKIDSSGAPTIKVAGIAKMVDIDSRGAAKIDTHKLHASRAVVESSGVSKIDLDVKDQLDVTISGPSTVTYEGDPVVKKTINGPGKLEKKATEGA